MVKGISIQAVWGRIGQQGQMGEWDGYLDWGKLPYRENILGS